MFIIANIVLLIATSLLLWKLVTTNHWTTGKKNLVAIVACLVWKVAFEVGFALYLYSPSIPLAVALANGPLIIAITCVTLIVHWFND